MFRADQGPAFGGLGVGLGCLNPFSRHALIRRACDATCTQARIRERRGVELRVSSGTHRNACFGPSFEKSSKFMLTRSSGEKGSGDPFLGLRPVLSAPKPKPGSAKLDPARAQSVNRKAKHFSQV